MEFGPQTLENIALAGDSAHIPDKSFGQLVACACEGVLVEESRNMIQENPAFKDVDKAILKSAYSGIVTLIIEAAKHDSNEQNISSVLEECKYTTERINEFNKAYLPRKSLVQMLLGKFDSSCPHVVDMDWRLDYYIKNSEVEKIDSPVFLISVKTQVSGDDELHELQFSCTLEQVQDLSAKLKDACKSMERLAQV